MTKQSDEMAKNVKVTESGNRQERYRDAIKHLGNKEASFIRQGGFFSLFNLAWDDGNLRPSITNILCAHIRETTNNKDYQKDYNTAPSTEIQYFLDLLFKEKKHSRDKLENFWEDLTPNLRGVYLKGVYLYKAQLQGAQLYKAQLQGAKLVRSQLQGAQLVGAQLQGARLQEAQLQGAQLQIAKLQGAQLQGVKLVGAQLQEAQLQGAQLQGAKLQGAQLYKAQLQGAQLEAAQLQGAKLYKAQLQGAQLVRAQLQGAQLVRAKLQGAQLGRAQLQGAQLEAAQLQGTVSYETFEPKDTFRSSILDRVGQDSEFSTVVFAGGVNKKRIDKWISILATIKTFTEEELKSFKEEMGKHVDREIGHNPPDGASTGKFNEEEAEKWITEYEKAMATVPKFIK